MIRILITGGTLDKAYNDLTGELYFPGSHVSAMLEQARCTISAVTEQLMLKDSLDMTDDDRELIKRACLAAPEQRVIVTHGTDTMVATARHIGPDIDGKTVVLFGAMIPFIFGRSDALFNFGCAIAAVQLLPAGVYIAMNGHIFTWDNVQKINSEGRFAYLRAEPSRFPFAPHA